MALVSSFKPPLSASQAYSKASIPIFSRSTNPSTSHTYLHLAQIKLHRSPNLHLHNRALSPILLAGSSPFYSETKLTDFDFVDDELDSVEEDSPWEGAVVYERNASVNHAEYSTTLERLGLAKISSEISRSKARAMGIRLSARMVKDLNLADETPVLISIDVTRRKRRVKLDGILRTVISLYCNRCTKPVAQSIYSNFALLLTEDPVEESDQVEVKSIHCPDNTEFDPKYGHDETEDDEKLINEDDKLYFPREEKEIDLSKHIRDLVHIEITIDSICNASCKGVCLECGTDLNDSSCKCDRKVERPTEYGPLGNLRNQMEQR